MSELQILQLGLCRLRPLPEGWRDGGGGGGGRCVVGNLIVSGAERAISKGKSRDLHLCSPV